MFGLKTKLLKHFDKINYPYGKLRQIRIYPMFFVCNHKCQMCWRLQFPLSIQRKMAKDEENHLTIQEYSHILSGLPKSVQSIELVGGGEPLLYPKIIDLLKLIKKKPVNGRLITNGSLLKNTISEALVGCAWDKVRVSIHAGSSKTYRTINGVDDYKKVIKNIKYLLSIRGRKKLPQISLLFVIQHNNVKDIKLFVQQAVAMGVDEIEFDSLIPKVPKTLLLSKNDRKTVISTLRELQKNVKIKNNITQALGMFKTHPKWNGNNHSINYFKTRYCQIVQGNLEIRGDGFIMPCCLMPDQMIGYNIRDGSINGAWMYYWKLRNRLTSGKFCNFCYKWCNYELEIK
jgi:MoaA/NifB/PqqE/SkfB family radical SAM enzyme